uniref:Uncharacterized protein n=1 Tax=Knipowitschia caucasica TaxID=637954 RepID=A0AAV2KP50_KNICA
MRAPGADTAERQRRMRTPSLSEKKRESGIKAGELCVRAQEERAQEERAQEERDQEERAQEKRDQEERDQKERAQEERVNSTSSVWFEAKFRGNQSL